MFSLVFLLILLLFQPLRRNCSVVLPFPLTTPTYIIYTHSTIYTLHMYILPLSYYSFLPYI